MSATGTSAALLSLLDRTVQRLAELQYQADGPVQFRGEFPMWLDGPVSRVDHNYLSGYTLLHVTLAAHHESLPPAIRRRFHAIMATATDLPARYQGTRLTGNWYSGRGSGQPAPAAYPWPDGQILCLHDDYDDTAISALLSMLGPFRPRAPFDPQLFLAAAYAPAHHALVPKSLRRLQVSGVARDVYQSWVLPAEPQPVVAGQQWLPPQNSVEMTTAANVFCAVHLLGGDPAWPTQRASKAFVNALARMAVRKLLVGDAAQLDFASSYYPRVPFAPLAFLLHDHQVTAQALLDPDVVALIVQAVVEVDPHAGWRMRGFANPVYWLNCCAWCVAGGYLDLPRVRLQMEQVWRNIRAAADDTGTWPDIVFFYAAHLGNYSGVAYVQALMAETMTLLHEIGLT